MGRTDVEGYLDFGAKSRWFVVANRAEAGIYREQEDKLLLVDQFFNPEGKLQEKNLVADRPGDSKSSYKLTKAGHGLDSRTHKHEEAAKKFAQEIGRRLEQELHKDGFTELVLVAEPHFLGMLRASLPEKVRRCVKRELKQEFVKRRESELRKFIMSAMERA